jgi:hypothetical protein
MESNRPGLQELVGKRDGWEACVSANDGLVLHAVIHANQVGPLLLSQSPGPPNLSGSGGLVLLRGS